MNLIIPFNYHWILIISVIPVDYLIGLSFNQVEITDFYYL